MEILKLLKANIKHKKGSFKSIAVLMAIIVFSFTGTVSNNDNLDKALTEAHQYVNTPDITAFIVERKADRSILDSISENPDITEVKVDPIKNNSQLITSSDVGPNADEWPNDSISEYYGKTIVLNSDTSEQ